MGRASRRKHEQRTARSLPTRSAATRYERITAGDPSRRVVGSDKKSKNIAGLCRLCGVQSRLLLGHVAPRWSAQWVKAEGGVVGRYRTIDIETRERDFPKHYFFCAPCEQRLGEAENYLRHFTWGTPREMKAISATVTMDRRTGLPTVVGLDARLLMRAVLGVVFKAHLAPSQAFAGCSLSRSEAAAVRRALETDEYSGGRFAVHVQRLMNRLVPGVNPRAMMHVHSRREAGGLIVRVNLGGMLWTVFIGPVHRHVAELARQTQVDFFLRAGRPLPVNPSEWALDPIAFAAIELTWDDLEEGEPIPPDAPCPCGLDATFADCCSDRWLASDSRLLAARQRPSNPAELSPPPAAPPPQAAPTPPRSAR